MSTDFDLLLTVQELEAKVKALAIYVGLETEETPDPNAG